MKITVLSGALPRAGTVPEIGNPETIRKRPRNVSTSVRDCYGEDSCENICDM